MELARVQRDIEVAAKINMYIASSLKEKTIFAEGRNMNYLINSMKLSHLAENPETARKVQEHVKTFKSD